MATPTRSRSSSAGSPPPRPRSGQDRFADLCQPVGVRAVVATFALSVLGLGLSAYLTYMHFSNPNGLACPVSTHIDCTKVVTSSWSVIFGIPVPVYGLAFFVAMVAMNSPWAWRLTSPLVVRARVAACVVGIGMVLWLVFVEIYKLDTICLWCTSVHLVTLILFVTVALVTVNSGLTVQRD